MTATPAADTPQGVPVLTQRLVTGPILIAALLLVVWLDLCVQFGTTLPRGLLLLVVAAVVSAMAARELASLAGAAGLRASAWIMSLGAWGVLVWTWLTPTLDPAHATTAVAGLLVVLMAVLAGTLLMHSRGQRTQGVLAAAGIDVLGVLALGGALSFYLLLRQDWSAWWIAAVVLITKSCDIGAYFTGMSIGRHKLIPWLSPGKTIEGLIGGCATAVVVSMGSLGVLGPDGHSHMTWGMAALLGLLLALAGQVGDLSMSLLKRSASVKDASSVLPGMGGVLDVIDSLLLAGPVAWVVLTIAE